MAMPASTRQTPSSQIVVGSDEPTALTANRAAAMCMTHSRPSRSASRPAIAAPDGRAEQGDRDDGAGLARRDVKCTWMPVTAPLMTALS